MHTPAHQPDLSRAHVALGLLGMSRAVEATRLLPPGHPGITRAAAAAAEDIQKALQDRAALTVTISPTSLLLDGEEADDRNLLRPLAEQLHAAELVALDFRPDFTPASVLEFAAALVAAASERVSGEALASRINRQSPGVQAVAADYSALRLRRGAGGPVVTRWDELARSIVGSLRTAGGRGAAARASEQLAQEPACAGAVQERLHELVRFGSGEDPAQAEAAVASVRSFVEALTPEARQSLTRIDPESPERSLELLADLADVLPTEDVLTALSEGAGKHRLSLHAMRLFNKMARAATGREDHLRRVQETLQRWRSSRDAAGAALKQSLTEVFHTRSQRDYVPDDYRARLAGLSARPLAADASAFAAMIDHRPELHAAEVAVLIARECRGIQCQGVYGYLRDSAPALATAGSLSTVLDALDAARTLAADDQTREAADALIRGVRSPSLLREALRASPAEPTPHLRRLLDEIGPAALGPVLEALSSNPGGALRQMLGDFISGAGGEEVAEALRQRLDADPAALPALEPQLRALPPQAVLSVLAPALRDSSPDARRVAYSVASSTLTDWPVELIEQALRLPDQLLHALAFEKLSRRHDPASLTLLANLVSARGGHAVDAALAQRAAAVLMNEGLAGLRLLSDALRQLCGEVVPARAAAARRLSGMLAPHAGHRCVRIALLRWRWCVARLVSKVCRP